MSIFGKNMIADVAEAEKQRAQEAEATLPLLDVDSNKLNHLISLMQLTHSLQNKPFKDRLQKISTRIGSVLPNATLQQWEDLLHDINYLDIDVLKQPLADSMIKYIHRQRHGNRERIQSTVSGLPISDEFKGLLAKYWYLNYGSQKNYILPDLFDGFSIEELLAYRKLPSIEGRTLALFDLRINDLTGLTRIPNIASIHTLNLKNNKLTTLPENIFDPFNNLQELLLANNQLTALPENIFNELNNLLRLYLYDNKLTALSENIFNGLNNLQELLLYDNKLTALPENIFNPLNNLQELNLKYNKLTTLSEKIFNPLNNSCIIYLKKNPLDPAIKERLKAQLGKRVKF